VGAFQESEGRLMFTKEQKRERYEAARTELEKLVGPVCVACGSDDKDWHFDHPHGRRYDVRKLGSYARLRRYLQDFRQGNGRRLCSTCNSSDGANRKYHSEQYEPAPF